MASTAPLRTHESPISTPLMRVWRGKRDEIRLHFRKLPAADAVFSLANTTMERPSGVFIGERSELRRVRQFLLVTPCSG